MCYIRVVSLFKQVVVKSQAHLHFYQRENFGIKYSILKQLFHKTKPCFFISFVAPSTETLSPVVNITPFHFRFTFFLLIVSQLVEQYIYHFNEISFSHFK